MSGIELHELIGTDIKPHGPKGIFGLQPSVHIFGPDQTNHRGIGDIIHIAFLKGPKLPLGPLGNVK